MYLLYDYTEQTTAKLYLHANIYVPRFPDQKSSLRKRKPFPVLNAINVSFTMKNYTLLIILHVYIIINTYRTVQKRCIQRT